jgi:hypothetical protein
MNSRVLVLCVWGLATGCGDAQTRAAIVEPCRGDIEKALPIIEECAAAALAERAFLEKTQHKLTAYTISSMEHEADRWYFAILIGDEKSPPPPGGHYMVAVDRATGSVEITPGA